MPESSNQNRLLPTSTTTGASALTAGFYTKASLEAALANSKLLIIPMGSAGDGPKRRGLELCYFASAGNNNKQATSAIWRVLRSFNPAGDQNDPWVYQLGLIGTVAITISLATGVANGPIGATELIADTLTWTLATDATTPKGIGDAVERVYGAPSSEAWPSGGSPAGDLPARLLLSDVGGGDVLVEMYTSGGGSASSDINCAWMSVT